MQRLGQHFLKNAAPLKKIIKALELGGNDAVIEVGPGHGELTALLVGQIVAIEKDKVLSDQLKKRGLENVEVLEGDALILLPLTVKERFNKKPYKIVGNIPYYITGKLLRTVSELENKPERTVLLVQREVAERICSVPPRMNRLAASVQFWAKPKIIGIVPKEEFSPPPKVDSAIILLETALMPDIAPEKYYAAVRAIFAQPRKTILNNVSAEKKRISGEKSQISKILAENNVLPEGRPQDLTVESIAAIGKAFF